MQQLSPSMKVYSPRPLKKDDHEGIKQALEEEGVCVITDILDQEGQDTFLNLFWDAIEKRKPALSRNDEATWTEANTDWYGTFGAGQYKHYGMAQEAHTWHIRKNPEIRRIFEECIFAGEDGQPEECCVSLDGCCALFRPGESGLKLHVDLVPGLTGCDWGVVQGAYNLYPVVADPSSGKANAGFVCVVGSHKQYQRIWDARKAKSGFKLPKKHWQVLEEDSPLQQECSLVTSPANSLVLWRADLLHKNYGGDFTCAELSSSSSSPLPPRLARLTQFITFMPKKYRTEQVLVRKAQAVLDGVCNNHWAALAFRVPITPFPAWSQAAKAIPIHKPTFEHLIPSKNAGASGDAKEIESDEFSDKTKKRAREEETSTKKIKKKGALVLDSLPADIVSLL